MLLRSNYYNLKNIIEIMIKFYKRKILHVCVSNKKQKNQQALIESVTFSKKKKMKQIRKKINQRIRYIYVL